VYLENVSICRDALAKVGQVDMNSDDERNAVRSYVSTLLARLVNEAGIGMLNSNRPYTAIPPGFSSVSLNQYKNSALSRSLEPGGLDAPTRSLAVRMAPGCFDRS
jgi:hypothetical protein